MNKLRVLYVDDEEELVSAVVERLEIRDIDAVGVHNGMDALRILKEEDFNVVLLDVRMPGLGGFDVIRRLKHAHPKVAVILISGHSSSEDVDEGLRLGAAEYLQKPIDIAELVKLIRRVANKAGADTQ